MVRIDSHLHVFAKASAAYPREVTAVCPAEREESVEKLLDVMTCHGVDQAVLVQMGGASVEAHRYLLECLAAHPNRFLGIGLIPAGCPDPAAHIEQLTDGTGIIGFRLSTFGGPRDIFEPMDVKNFTSYPIWECAAAQDHVLWLYPNAIEAHLLPYLITAFPQVRVVLNHLGVCPGKGKFHWDALGRPQITVTGYNLSMHTTYRLARFENVYVHLSGQYAFSKEPYPYQDLAGWHRSLLTDFGPKRLMWATDFPWILEEPGYGALTEVVETLLPSLSESELSAIMGGNAKRFLRFPDL